MAKTPEPEPLYTVKQVAELDLLPFHPETIRQMCRKGPTLDGIRSVRPGTHRTASYYILASAIEEWKTRNAYSSSAR